MAELLECLICGYKTVRCGMTNHLKAKHGTPDGGVNYYDLWTVEMFTKSLGQVKNWSKDRTQEAKQKSEE